MLLPLLLNLNQLGYPAVSEDGISVDGRQTAGEALLSQTTHRLVSLWKIVRTDGFTLRFTDHSNNIAFVHDGAAYETAGFQPSARRAESGLKETTVDVVGYLDDARLNVDELTGGAYRHAQVTEFIVDWKFPYFPIREYHYWIQDATFDGLTFSVDLGGVTVLLQQLTGHEFWRPCPYHLGDADCRVNLNPYRRTGVEIFSVADRQNFACKFATLPSTEDDYYSWGKVTWTVGRNNGTTQEIGDYDDSGRAFVLIQATPYDIAVGDRFTVEPGCDGLRGTCITKFDNLKNYGGHLYLPGTDAHIVTPTRV